MLNFPFLSFCIFQKKGVKYFCFTFIICIFDNRHVSTAGNFNLCFYTIFLHLFRAYYENTVPQWYKFHMIMWRRMQEAIDVILLKKNSDRFLIVSGTYSTFTLHDKTIRLRSLYLYLPNTFNVPKFIWKLVYNYNTRKGTVYIGLNTAFHTLIKERRMCKASMCPGFPSSDEFVRAFVYCCSKDAFELTYGRIDPYVYQKFWFDRRHQHRQHCLQESRKI